MRIECPESWNNCDTVGYWVENTYAVVFLGITFDVILLAQFLILSILFFKLKISPRRRLRSLRVLIINVCCLVVRCAWWPLNMFEYAQYSVPLITRTFLNRVAFLLIYLGQSFYVQTWLVVLMVYVKGISQTLFKVLFGITDAIICILMGIGACATVLAPKDYKNDHMNTVYEIGSITMAFASIILIVSYPIITFVIICKLGATFRLCSKTNLTMFVVTVFLLGCNISRSWCLLFQYFYPGQLIPYIKFSILCYLFPDTISLQTISFMMFMQYLTQRKEPQTSIRSQAVKIQPLSRRSGTFI